MTPPVYTLTLTMDAIEKIGIALNEAPYKIAAPVINEIRKQMVEQEAQFEAALKEKQG